MSDDRFSGTPEQRSLIGKVLAFFLQNKLVVALFVFGIVVAGLAFAPLD